MARARVVFDGPGPQVNGLSAAADGLWVCDQQNDKIYLITYENGSVLTSFDSPARNLSGIAWGGYAVWGASNKRPSMVFKHNPWTGHCLAGITLPNADQGGVHGIEWANNTLWVTRPGLLTLQCIRTDTGELISEIPFPSPRSHGLYWDAESETIVCVETNNHHVFRLDPKDGRVLEDYVIDDFEPHGMTRDAQGRIWVCDATTNRIAILDL
ncbi:MAG TPA: hypothetical protein VMP10_04115 [Chloroflexota bacterium]|nr:hypothetical protein [Chloroflexota bacterium]